MFSQKLRSLLVGFRFKNRDEKRRRRTSKSRTLTCQSLEDRKLYAADAFTGIYNGGNWNVSSQPAAISFGLPGDQPVIGDWNGDGRQTPGVFRNGTWVLDMTGNGFDGGDRVLSFGLPGDKAVAGDWNGDGVDTVGVFRNGWWFFDRNGNGYDAADINPVSFGWGSDIPVVGDWNGNGKDTPGIYRNGTWALDIQGNGFDGADRFLQFGLPGAQPVAGDWNGNGVDTPAVLQNNQWFFDLEGNGYTGEAGHTNSLGAGTAVGGNGVYRPIPGTGIDFNVRLTPNYNPNSPNVNTVGVNVRLTSPKLVTGDFSVRLYWASGPNLSSPNLVFAGERFASVKNYRGDVGVRFTSAMITPRPDTATHLIAVANEDNAVREINHANNTKSVMLAPRTFIFKVAGFANGFGSDFRGLNLSGVTPSNKSPVIDVPTIVAPSGATRGEDILANARSVIAATLSRYHAVTTDRVILIGHSYGGEVARQLAPDVMPAKAGAQPAFGLVLIDPIDYALVANGQINQATVTKPLPIVKASSVMNISANPDASAAFKGYQIANARTKPSWQRLWYGDDKARGTADDVKHWSIDDDPKVHLAINRFLDVLVG